MYEPAELLGTSDLAQCAARLEQELRDGTASATFRRFLRRFNEGLNRLEEHTHRQAGSARGETDASLTEAERAAGIRPMADALHDLLSDVVAVLPAQEHGTSGANIAVEGAKVVRPDESLCQFNVRTATPDWEFKKISQEQHLNDNR